MTTKILGISAVLLASVLFGVRISERKKKRLYELKGICELIRYIKNNIDSFLTPLPRIFKSFSYSYLDSCGFTEILHTDGIRSALSHSDISLSKEEKELLREFGDSLGKGYRDEEIKRCDYYLNIFSEILTVETAETAKNDKLYKLIPVMAVLCIVILLI